MMKIKTFLISFILLYSCARSQNLILNGTVSFVNVDGSTPPASISVAVTDHRYDAVATVSLNTDTRVATSIWYGELLGFKNNIRLGVYVEQSGYTTNEGAQDATGLVMNDYYMRAQSWRNPVTAAYEGIPDWSAVAWTPAGVAVFPVTLGAAKTSSYPSQGQQLYDVSGGAYGYDFVSGHAGTNNMAELTDFLAFNKGTAEGRVGRKLTAAAWSLGRKEAQSVVMQYFLAGRGTGPGLGAYNAPYNYTTAVNGRSYYGPSKDGHGNLGWPQTQSFTRQYWAYYPSTTRWQDMQYDTTYSLSQANTYTLNQLDTAIAYRGWFNDFGHWHTLRSRSIFDKYDTLLQNIRTRIGSNFVWTCRPGEAIEYMYARTTCSAISASQAGGTVTVTATYTDPFAGTDTAGLSFAINTDLLQTPITARIDLTGTSLAGGIIQSSYGKVISRGGNIWIVEIPFDTATNVFTPVALTAASDSSDVLNTSVPIISSINVVGHTLTVVTNIPTKAALFSVATGGADIDYVNAARSNTLTTSHVFTLTTGNDYRVGVISEFKQAKLSSTISH